MKEKIAELREKLQTLTTVIRLPERAARIAELEKRSMEPDFWNDNRKAKVVLKEADTEKKWVTRHAAADKAVHDAADFLAMLSEGDDPEVRAELERSVAQADKEIEGLELMKMLGGEDDACDAIFEINSGAGGTESMDWANMLLRMYTRYFEKQGYAHTLLDIMPGEESGIKSAAVEVKGEFAYGYLKAEMGVHRLVRISPFDSNARRHTSFASVSVIPLAEDLAEVEVKDDDLRVDTFRSSGAGGQHVNKTESAVRMTHLPTGIVASCQTERSQIKNRDICMKMLRARLLVYFREEEEKKRDAKAVEKKKIEWGSQIRSYVLHPYRLVKDARTGVETSDTEGVLDGDLHEFVRQYLLTR